MNGRLNDWGFPEDEILQGNFNKIKILKLLY